MIGRSGGAATGARVAVGVVVACLLLWIIFRDTDWLATTEALRGVHRAWLGLAFTAAFGGQFVRAGRMMVIVRGIRPLSYANAFRATQIGLLLNVALPMRVGEAARVFVLVRQGGLSIAVAVASAVVDRISDMIALLAIACIAVVAMPEFGGIHIASGMIGNTDVITVPAAAITSIAATLAASLFLILTGLAVVRTAPHAMVGGTRKATALLPSRAREYALRLVRRLSEMANQGASPRSLACAVLLSFIAWACGIVSLYALLTAFGLKVPWGAPFVILTLIAAFVAAPLTPGLVGQYHVPVLAGVLLVDPDVAEPTAKAAVIAGYLLFLLPVSVLGVIALLSTRMRAWELFKRVRENLPDE